MGYSALVAKASVGVGRPSTSLLRDTDYLGRPEWQVEQAPPGLETACEQVGGRGGQEEPGEGVAKTDWEEMNPKQVCKVALIEQHSGSFL